MVNIDDHFKTAHLESYPVPMCGMSRDFFNRNKKEVMTAAKKYGYYILGATKQNPEGKSKYGNEQMTFFKEKADAVT